MRTKLVLLLLAGLLLIGLLLNIRQLSDQPTVSRNPHKETVGYEVYVFNSGVSPGVSADHYIVQSSVGPYIIKKPASLSEDVMISIVSKNSESITFSATVGSESQTKKTDRNRSIDFHFSKYPGLTICLIVYSAAIPPFDMHGRIDPEFTLYKNSSAIANSPAMEIDGYSFEDSLTINSTKQADRLKELLMNSNQFQFGYLVWERYMRDAVQFTVDGETYTVLFDFETQFALLYRGNSKRGEAFILPSKPSKIQEFLRKSFDSIEN